MSGDYEEKDRENESTSKPLQFYFHFLIHNFYILEIFYIFGFSKL